MKRRSSVGLNLATKRPNETGVHARFPSLCLGSKNRITSSQRFSTSVAWERSLKRGLLPSHGRIRRGPEGSSRKVDVRRSWDPRVETTTGTPCLEEMPITNGRHHRPSQYLL